MEYARLCNAICAQADGPAIFAAKYVNIATDTSNESAEPVRTAQYTSEMRAA